jgi:hypothetical protein
MQALFVLQNEYAKLKFLHTQAASIPGDTVITQIWELACVYCVCVMRARKA